MQCRGSDLVFLHSNPLVDPNGKPCLPSLDSTSEIEVIKSALRSTKKDIVFRSQIATTDALLDTFNRGTRCLHFSGHGKPEFVTFEHTAPRLGILNPVLDSRFGAVLNFSPQAAGELELVFVSACHSENIGHTFAKFGIPHVVAVKVSDLVLDEAAVSFARTFYTQLFQGQTVKNAFALAKVEVQHQTSHTGQLQDNEANKFILLPVDGNHDAPLSFVHELQPGDVRDMTPSIPSVVPRLGPAYRRDLVQSRTAKLVRECCTQRLLSIIGPSGVGKSSLLIDSLRYMIERDCRVGWVPCAGKHDNGLGFQLSAVMSSADSLATFVARALQLEPGITTLASLTDSLQQLPGTTWIAFDGIQALDAAALQVLLGPQGLICTLLSRCHDRIKIVLTGIESAKHTVPAFAAFLRDNGHVESEFQGAMSHYEELNCINMLLGSSRNQLPLPPKHGSDDPVITHPRISEMCRAISGIWSRIFQARDVLAQVESSRPLSFAVEQVITTMSNAATPSPSPIVTAVPDVNTPSATIAPFTSATALDTWLKIVSASCGHPVLASSERWHTVVPWHFIKPIVVERFNSLSRCAPRRVMSDADAEHAIHQFCHVSVLQSVPPQQAQRFGSDWSNPEVFANGFAWLEAVAQTCYAIRKFWCFRVPDPRETHVQHPIIRGFEKRMDTEHRLNSHAHAGMFVLRFSDSSPGNLACVFVDQSRQVQHSLVTFLPNGCVHDSGTEREYRDFQTFVLECQHMLFFEPGFRKQDVITAVAQTPDF